MTAEPSPRPWRVVAYEEGSGQCDIYDANGTPVCTMGHIADQPEADAALIVAAVNERDRLRDIVRRLAKNIERYHLVGVRERALLREARAAIGEDASP